MYPDRYIGTSSPIVVRAASQPRPAKTCSRAAWSNSFTVVSFVCPHTYAVEKKKHASALQSVIRLLTTVPAYTVRNVLCHQRMFGACLLLTSLQHGNGLIRFVRFHRILPFPGRSQSPRSRLYQKLPSVKIQMMCNYASAHLWRTEWLRPGVTRSLLKTNFPSPADEQTINLLTPRNAASTVDVLFLLHPDSL